MRFIDLTGQRFGKLTAIRFHGRVKNTSMWLWKCDCGNEKLAIAGNIKCGGDKSSCGCETKRRLIERNTTHGLSKIPEYQTWKAMVDRCYLKKNISYPNYGARGIKVCDRWLNGENGLHGFQCFLSDMGNFPFPAASIERKDYNGHYDPDNCIWIKRSEQNRNTRRNRWVIYQGKHMILQDAVKLSGIHQATINDRLANGWTEYDALHTPVKSGKV